METLAKAYVDFISIWHPSWKGLPWKGFSSPIERFQASYQNSLLVLSTKIQIKLVLGFANFCHR